MSEVEALSDGETRIGPGTLYRSLQRMEAEGLIEQTRAFDEDGDPRRRSYALTPAGRDALTEQAQHLSRLVRAAVNRGVLPAPNQQEEILCPT